MRFTSELMLATRELARVRADIAHADTAVISPSSPVQERGAAVRASAYVWLAALLERIVRDSLQATLCEITQLAVPVPRRSGAPKRRTTCFVLLSASTKSYCIYWDRSTPMSTRSSTLDEYRHCATKRAGEGTPRSAMPPRTGQFQHWIHFKKRCLAPGRFRLPV